MTVGLVIVSHSARLADGVAELAGQMTQGATPIAAAGGAANDVLGTSADRILAAIAAVESADGVLILLDLGSAILSAEMALEMLEPGQREHIALSYAPLVEGALAASLEASLGRSLTEVRQAAEKTARRDQLRKLKPLSSVEDEGEDEDEDEEPGAVAPPTQATDYREAQLVLNNPTGLHARPASLFVQTAHRFQASVQVLARGRQAQANSITGVLSLGARQGDALTIRASGAEAGQALDELVALVRANFYENPAEPVARAPQAAPPPPAPSPSSARQAAWQGVSTSAGVALGPALLYTTNSQKLSDVERRSIADGQVLFEQQRLRGAVDAAILELQTLAAGVQERVGKAEAAIIEAQVLMLQDPALLEAALQRVQEQRLAASSALATVAEQQALVLEGLDDPLLAGRAADVRDAAARALHHLSGAGERPQQKLGALAQPVVLLAQDLTPSDTSLLRPESVLGICTVQGGPTAHAAILARALGIPAMAGIDAAALEVIRDGDEVGLDAERGLLYHRPSEEIRTSIGARLAEHQRARAALKSSVRQGQAPVDIAGRHISLLANIGSEAEAAAAREWGAEGIGLLRTEFLFARAAQLPDEEEQRRLYTQLFHAFSAGRGDSGGPIVVRTLDAGADKPMPALERILGARQEANPALGLRGLRISLAHQELFERQLSAVMLAAADTGVELHIMVPMLSTVEELRAARAVFTGVYTRLTQRSVALPARIPFGIMVEVPSAVLMAAELAELADFFSIGANDLLQYTLACDRTNASIAYLYHPMQPAVLRFIAQIAAVARQAGKAVAVCGEIASDERLAPVLVGLGVDELSMTPTALPAVRAALSGRSARELSELGGRVLRARTVAEVESATRG